MAFTFIPRWITICIVVVMLSESIVGVHGWRGMTGWNTGRATFYGDNDGDSIDRGSCGWGKIPDWERDKIAAVTDRFPGMWGGGTHNIGCGQCFEVKCKDGATRGKSWSKYGWNSPCYNKGKSIIVKVTDTCKCYYKPKEASNRRWCCGDVPHFDLSAWAFYKLANRKWGVMDIDYRRVKCDHLKNAAPYMQVVKTHGKFWKYIAIKNVAGNGNIKKVYLRGKWDNNWRGMWNDWGGIWVTNNAPQSFPASIKVVGTDDREIVLWNQIWNFNLWSWKSLKKQFW